ncbi:hypothetical protein B0H17DRAFT_1245121 [Mycena rosella]|uniref:Uncharacterized protein n=1 Tax=Mycena rosella TaxID=1033263 RepID=A0AAD7CZF2_MYCRO|nr:hypothetical protein B0H17DRAFT_1245121 [Mycena rosella]
MPLLLPANFTSQASALSEKTDLDASVAYPRARGSSTSSRPQIILCVPAPSSAAPGSTQRKPAFQRHKNKVLIHGTIGSPAVPGLPLAGYPERVPTPHPDLFVRFLNIPFLRLSSLRINHFGVPAPDSKVSAGIKRMLSLPTLQALNLTCRFTDSNHFLTMWENCSPSIKHLTLYCGIEDNGAAPAVAIGLAARRLIVLSSFRTTDTGQIHRSLDDPRCPLDFSQLKALRIGVGSYDLERGILVPALKTVEVLALLPNHDDLSIFERITDLHLHISQPFDTTHRCRRTDPDVDPGAEHYFPLLDSRISVEWDFWPDEGEPWYRSIV